MIDPDKTQAPTEPDSVDEAFEILQWRRFQRERTERLRAYTDLLKPLLAAAGYAIGEQSFPSGGADSDLDGAVKEAALAVLADVRRIAEAARVKGES